MEKKYLNNLYKNMQKYNIKINNNYYIINKIKNLIGGTLDEKLGELETHLGYLTTGCNEANIAREARDKQDVEQNKKLIDSMTEFLDLVETKYIKKSSIATTEINDETIDSLNKLNDIFDAIRTNVTELTKQNS